MFTEIHKNTDYSVKKAFIKEHLCKMMYQILKKEGRKLTPELLAIVNETAESDLLQLEITHGINSYYQRLLKGAI